MADPILLIEDDHALGTQLVEQLQRAGFVVTWIRDGDEARSAEPERFRLIVLDLMLPGTYGMDLLKIFRRKAEIPVLILSARDDTSDKVRGLRLGADDYLTKPFFPEELLARIQALLRRPTLVQSERVTVGAITLDLETRAVTLGGKALSLTRVEFDILSLLARRKDSAVTRQALSEGALDSADLSSGRTLDVHISRLRHKLGDAASQLQTVWGIGYKLCAEVSS